MVLSHIANKLGLWDLVAPSKRQSPQEIHEDEKLAQKLQKEEEARYRKLKTQFDIEKNAESMNQFVKRQRVSYHSKIDDTWIDAVVVGVHLDDGPDKPYYTIKYMKIEIETAHDGEERTTEFAMEKQTNAERLMRLPWDEDKTWDLIK